MPNTGAKYANGNYKAQQKIEKCTAPPKPWYKPWHKPQPKCKS